MQCSPKLLFNDLSAMFKQLMVFSDDLEDTLIAFKLKQSIMSVDEA